MSFATSARVMRTFLTQLCFGLLLSTFGALAWGATQRMFLPTQSFTIKSGGAAGASAMCLDAGWDEPAAGSHFTSAPANLGDIRIKASGRPEMSLQQAIDEHIVDVRGNGGFSSVEFHNLLPKGDIKVEVRKASVVLPDKSYQTEDLLGLPQLAPGAAKVDQDELWDARMIHGGQNAGIPVSYFTRDGYDVDPNDLSSARRWVQKQSSRGASARSFVLYRFESSKTAAPAYALFTDRSAPRVFQGNESLAEAGEAIRADWHAAGMSGPPRVVLTADVSPFAKTRRPPTFSSGRL